MTLEQIPSTGEEWAKLISTEWRKSVAAIIETGRLLIEARRALSHGAWRPMVRDLPFGEYTAQRLMRIANDPKIAKASHGRHLPPSWRTLYELRKLKEDEFETRIADGTINPDMQRKEISRESRARLRALDEKRIARLTPRPGRYHALVIDPPWDYGALSLAGRAAPGYATMAHAELLALPVGGWAEENCHLYLWTTNNFIGQAVELMAHWGFEHKTVLTWVKPRWGLGSYFRNSTEHVLFGVRGELRTRSDAIGTHFDAPVSKHSEKPEQFYEIVRRASWQPFGEAFQREARPDFTNVFVDEKVEAAEGRTLGRRSVRH